MATLVLKMQLPEEVTNEKLADNRILQGILIGKFINDAIDSIFERYDCYFNESLNLVIVFEGNSQNSKDYKDFFNDEELLLNMSMAAIELYHQQVLDKSSRGVKLN